MDSKKRESRKINSDQRNKKKIAESLPSVLFLQKQKLKLRQFFNRFLRPMLRGIGNVLISLNCQSDMGWVMGMGGPFII